MKLKECMRWGGQWKLKFKDTRHQEITHPHPQPGQKKKKMEEKKTHCRNQIVSKSQFCLIMLFQGIRNCRRLEPGSKAFSVMECTIKVYWLLLFQNNVDPSPMRSINILSLLTHLAAKRGSQINSKQKHRKGAQNNGELKEISCKTSSTLKKNLKHTLPK